MSDSVGIPATVTASLKPSVSVTVSPTCSVPVPGEAVACVTAGKIGSIWRPLNVFTAPERSAARPEPSLMLAPVGRLTPVMASAEVVVSVDATVVRKVSALVPEPLT